MRYKQQKIFTVKKFEATNAPTLQIVLATFSQFFWFYRTFAIWLGFQNKWLTKHDLITKNCSSIPCTVQLSKE